MARQKTMMEIVVELSSRGHSVQYYIRRDGGILIQSIDGVKFKGATGNAAARGMLGEAISTKREKQLKKATKTKKQLSLAEEDVKKEWRRVREIWREKFPSSKRSKSPIGTFSWGRIAWALRNVGKEEAMRRIQEAERYALGLAYSRNVEALAGAVREYAYRVSNKEDQAKLFAFSDKILEGIGVIQEKSIYQAYQRLYDLNHGVSVAQVISEVNKILFGIN